MGEQRFDEPLVNSAPMPRQPGLFRPNQSIHYASSTNSVLHVIKEYRIPQSKVVPVYNFRELGIIHRHHKWGGGGDVPVPAPFFKIKNTV
jgi:hypothetical protein